MSNLTVSSAAGRRLSAEITRLRGRAKSLKEESRAQGEVVMRTATVGATAFGLGYVGGRYGERAEVFGIPPEIAAAVGGHVAAFAGWMPDDYGHAIGDAGLAAYATGLGAGMGVKAKTEAGE
jgi:hypothetical protein